jgi:hypothetical protein
MDAHLTPVAEADGLGDAGVAEAVGEQGHAAAVLHRLQLHGVASDDDLAAAGFGEGESGLVIIDASSITGRVPGATGRGRGRRACRAGGPGTGRLGRNAAFKIRTSIEPPTLVGGVAEPRRW